MLGMIDTLIEKESRSQIGASSSWQAFKHHKVLIEVKELRVRIGRVAELVLQLLDPFAAGIVYHYKCWMKYVTNPLHQTHVTRHFQNYTFLR